MKIKDSIIKYDRGVRKVIEPEKTIDSVINKMRKMKLPILKKCQKIQTSKKVFLYQCYGTEYYEKVVGRPKACGKGHTNALSLASALMEMAERYSCYKFLNNRKGEIVTTFKKLKNNMFRAEDIYLNIMNVDFIGEFGKNELIDCEMGFKKIWTLNGELAYMPVNFISHTLEVTNGMASGNTLEEAILHGIHEIIERHCKTMIMNKKLCVKAINIESIDSSIAKQIIGEFKKYDKEVMVRDFSLGLSVPVIGVARKLSNGKYIVTIGVASNAGEALIRALTENVQLEDEPSFYLGKEAITNIIGNDTSIKFNDLPNSQDENIKNELKIINAILNNNNMKIYFCDATDPELGVPCVITYISGAKIAARENFDLNLLSGVIYESHRLGNIRRGVEYIDYAKKDGPQWLYYSGLSKLRENDFNGALSYFAKISEKNSPIKYIKFGLYCYALCCLAMGREKEAIKVFKKLLYVYNFLYGNYEHAELKNEISEIANNYELFLKTHEYYIQNIW